MTTWSTPQLNIIITRTVVTVPIGTTTRKVWAWREDFTTRDERQQAEGTNYSSSEARYFVRPFVADRWEVGDYFTDDEGNRRQVLSFNQVEQHAHQGGRMLELVARVTG